METTADLRPVILEERSVPSPALVVDLDGTLVKTDLLLESLLALLRQQPAFILALPVWLLKGKAYLKQEIARRVSLDVGLLPYREQLVDYLKAQRAQGRTIVLATGGDMRIAEQVADHLKLFDLVLASDGHTNLSGECKRARLVKEFGEKGFDYVGNDRRDLTVWPSARRAIVVNPSPRVRSRVAGLTQVDRIFEEPKRGLVDYLKALRPQQWLKNLLVFVPLLGAHRVDEIALLGKALLAFVAFGCLASSGYLMNDLFDLAADRRHPRKRYRSFAAGDLPLSYAFRTVPVLLVLGCFAGTLVSPMLAGVALIYFGLSASYSLYARQIVLLDVLVLAGLYTLRIIAGTVSVDIWPSPWLLAFSTFLFFSLALVKRYSELALNHVPARGYEPSDQELLMSMGIASGYVAILVLALYINTATAHLLYKHYGVLWVLCPLLFYWISHMWLSAHRGKMPDDPVVFATNDWTSRVLIVLMVATVALAL